jgi:5'-nucleotidase
MDIKHRPQILLTNDDGIDSPGLWAAAKALSRLGFVTVSAPRDQSTATGHSLPITSDGTIQVRNLRVDDQNWVVHAIGGSPAQAVLHGILEVLPTPPDLVVSGINYGENIGNSITISGTIGAAQEAASLGIPALAVSLEMESPEYYYSHSPHVDFSSAGYFTGVFAQMLLEKRMPFDVDILKLDIPAGATPETPWRVTRQSRHRFYVPYVVREGSWDDKGVINVNLDSDPEKIGRDTDIYAIIHDKVVSVTPLSLDMTSRVDPGELAAYLKK